ncbi:MAG: hypothetical protein WBR18_14290 [Anaerolineales bacterium]
MLPDAPGLRVSSIRSHRAAIIAVAVLAGLGAVAVIYATRLGPWAFNDSVVYMVSARNLVHGRGLGVQLPGGGFQPTSGHPPLYPISIALLTWMGMAELSAAQVLNVLLLSVSVLALGLGLIRLGWRPWLALLTPVIVLGHPAIFDLYLGAISEPLFLTLTLSGFISLALYLEQERRLKWLWLSAVALSMAWMARYAGLAGLFAAACCLALLSGGNLKKRVLRAGGFTVVAAIPMVAWLAWLRLLPAAQSPRPFLWDPVTFPDRFRMLRAAVVDNLWGWLPLSGALPPVPYRLRLAALAILAALISLAWVWLGFRRWRDRPDGQGAQPAFILATLSLLFGVSYLAILFVTLGFTYPVPNLDARILSPLLVAGLLLVLADLAMLISKVGSSAVLAKLVLVGAIGISVLPLPRTYNLVHDLHREGRGFSSYRWRESGVLELLASMPASLELVSNDPGPILFWTNRPAHLLPLLQDPPEQAGQVHPFGTGQGNGLEARFDQGEAALVLFDSLYWQLHPIYGDSTNRAIERLVSGAQEFGDSWDGIVYVSSPRQP